MITKFEKNSCLLLIDVQVGVDVLSHWGGPTGRRNNHDAEVKMLNLLAAWRKANLQVAFTRHDSREATSPLKFSLPTGAQKPGFEPEDILKAVHTSIAVDRGKVPSSNPEGENILTSLNLEDVKEKVKKLTSKARDIWYKNFDYDNDDQIANHLYKNLKILVDRGYMVGGPGRKDMPQTDADKTPSKTKLDPLAKGEINITKPFESKISLKSLLNKK